jgi:hypothetical protein
MEISDFMDLVRHGQMGNLSGYPAKMSGEMAALCAARVQYAEIKLTIDPAVAKRIQSAQIAALSSHSHILEDGPQLPKVSAPRAEAGGEILEGICTSQGPSTP